MPSEPLRAIVARALAGSGLVQLGGMLLSFLVGVQLARGLGVEGYGIYGIAMAIAAIACVPGEFGVSQLVAREVASGSASGDGTRLFGVVRWADRTVLLLGTPAGLLLIAIAWLLATGASRTQLLAIAWAAPMVPLVAWLQIRGAALRGLNFLVLGQVPGLLLRPLFYSALLLGLFHLIPDADAADAMAAAVASLLLVLANAHLLLRSRLPQRPAVAEHHPGTGWLASSIPMALTEGMRILQGQLSVLLLGILAAPAEVGLLRIALSTVVIVAVPISLANAIAGPLLARLHAGGDITRMQLLSTQLARLMSAGVLLLASPILLLGPPLLEFLYGREYGAAFWPLAIMCAGQFASAVFGPNAMLLNMTGRERRVTRGMFVALLTNGAITLSLAPALGPSGAAIGMTMSVLVWNLAAWRDAKRLLGIDTSFIGNPSQLPKNAVE